MACYWGCQAKANKVVWSICAFLFFTGIVLVIAGIIGGFTGDKCFQRFQDCMDMMGNDRSNAKECQNVANSICKYKTWVGLIVAGVVIFGVGFAPFCYFCCCANDPNKSHNGMQMGSVQVAGMQNMPYPAQGQPVYPVQVQPYNPGMVQAQPYNPGMVQAQPYYPPK